MLVRSDQGLDDGIPIFYLAESSELDQSEDLLDVTEDGVWLDLQHVELHSLGQLSALTNGHDITFLNSESWGDVSWDIVVSLLVSVVFSDVVKVVSSDDDGSVHLGRDADSSKKVSSQQTVI